MIHVGLHSVGTYHKNLGDKIKKIKIYFAECLNKTLGKDSFAECQLRGTRQRIGKESLPSVPWATLGKAYFKIKKNFVECQITGTRQSALHTNGRTLLPHSLSLTHSLKPAAAAPSPSSRRHRRRRAVPTVPALALVTSQPRPPCPRSPCRAPRLSRPRPRPRPSCPSPSPSPSPVPPPRSSPCPRPPPPPRSSPCPRHFPVVPSPARRLARDPSPRSRRNLQGDCFIYVIRV
jgi:hypothetical protein